METGRPVGTGPGGLQGRRVLHSTLYGLDGVATAMKQAPSLPSTVELALARAFAPMHKRVMGLAVGITAAATVWLLTAFHVLVQPKDALSIELLAQVFYGYAVTWRGAFVGAWWAFVAGFVAGWFAAFLHNLTLAIWLTVVRVKTNLRETRDFLDQI